MRIRCSDFFGGRSTGTNWNSLQEHLHHRAPQLSDDLWSIFRSCITDVYRYQRFWRHCATEINQYIPLQRIPWETTRRLRKKVM